MTEEEYEQYKNEYEAELDAAIPALLEKYDLPKKLSVVKLVALNMYEDMVLFGIEHPDAEKSVIKVKEYLKGLK